LGMYGDILIRIACTRTTGTKVPISQRATITNLTSSPLNRGNCRVVIEYLPDGSILAETPYENGKMFGTKKTYYLHKKINSEQECTDGREMGEYKEYDEDGHLVFEGVRGEKLQFVGKTKRYIYINGKLNEIRIDEDGNILSSEKYDENGKLIETKTYKNKTFKK